LQPTNFALLAATQAFYDLYAMHYSFDAIFREVLFNISRSRLLLLDVRQSSLRTD